MSEYPVKMDLLDNFSYAFDTITYFFSQFNLCSDKILMRQHRKQYRKKPFIIQREKKFFRRHIS